MRRREFVAGIAATVAYPLSVAAQPAGGRVKGDANKLARVVLLNDSFEGPFPPDLLHAFIQALSVLGWIEDKNLSFTYRYAENPQQRADIAAEVSALRSAVVVATPPAAFYFGPLASGIPVNRTVPAPIVGVPIVFVGVTDPIAAGMVRSLAKPGGMMTGLSYQGTELVPKRLELLKKAVPHLTRVGVLSAPAHPLRQRMVGDAETAARHLGVEVKIFEVPVMSNPGLLDAIFRLMTQARVEGVLGLPAAPFFRERTRIAALALQHKLPLIFDLREYVEAGSLIGYAPSKIDIYRRAAGFVDRILQGASPADMPVEHPTKFELVINRSTARSLGLTIPPSLLARADQIIE
jgi:putative ABC transport system substrate-binding protein